MHDLEEPCLGGSFRGPLFGSTAALSSPVSASITSPSFFPAAVVRCLRYHPFAAGSYFRCTKFT